MKFVIEKPVPIKVKKSKTEQLVDFLLDNPHVPVRVPGASKSKKAAQARAMRIRQEIKQIQKKKIIPGRFYFATRRLDNNNGAIWAEYDAGFGHPIALAKENEVIIET